MLTVGNVSFIPGVPLWTSTVTDNSDRVLSLLGEVQHSSWWGESFPWLCSTTACVQCSQLICVQQVWCCFEVLQLSCTCSLLCLQSPSNSVTPQAPQAFESDLLYTYVNVEVFPFVAPSYIYTSLILKLTSCALSCLEELLSLLIMFCSQSLTRRTLSTSSTTLT